MLEVWRITPAQSPCGTIIPAHGLGPNRDRIMGCARFFGSLGFTTVIHSARDHGGSSSCRWMNATKFVEDIAAVKVFLNRAIGN